VEKKMPRIESIHQAAIRWRGEIFTGTSHGAAYEALQEKYPDADVGDLETTDGFTTNTGRFVNRAMAFAIASGSDTYVSNFVLCSEHFQ
jgi:hypothetical protein